MNGLIKLLGRLSGNAYTCAYCGREINGPGVCASCAQKEAELLPDGHVYEGCLFVFYYGGPIKKLIHDVKYNDMPRHTTYIAQKMFDLINRLGTEADLISYVPVHKSRLSDRGFDQSEMIAAHLSYLMGLPFEKLFVRTKKTRPQFELSASERAENMKGAFSLADGIIIEGKKILLVDDIYTTGASMNECIKLIADRAKAIPFVFSRDKAL